MTRVRRALLSVSDKTGLIPFAAGLAGLGVELISTGGTARALREAGLRVTDVAEITGSPEMLDGRVKTLHPRIHGGLLGIRENPEHERQMAAQGIVPIDLVAITLYPFEATTARPDVSLAEAVENIDIGGPAMIRSAAKNFEAVAVIVDPQEYGSILDELKRNDGWLSRATRFGLARKAFAHTARYDALIAGYLESGDLASDGSWLSATQGGTQPTGHWPEVGRVPGSRLSFPHLLHVRLEKVQELRYGENPHQRAAFYRDLALQGGIAAARQLQGKELSYNNLMDLHAAWELAQEWNEPVVAIIKHTNPCGVATAAELVQAYARARDTDPISAYGGVLGVNRPLDAATAREIASTFVEAVVAPEYTAEALSILKDRKNLRLLEMPSAMGHEPSAMSGFEMRRVSGGMLVQDRDDVDLDPGSLKVVTRRAPTDAEMRALRFAWRVAKHVKSNAIVLATEHAAVGIGAGQMSRVDSAKLARMKANFPTQGTALASDAFFPFRDAVDAAAEAGVTAVIQPGGSVRDAEVIAAADEHGMAMVFTGIRHFRH
ncbi:MAG: bifunctional phosphoribosylaminoimidazolecarboxamide formyltransferase/IMP cyclohydrolase [candidate division NC10 bacterium RIFCSPLOWO2_02_FULL_66_22]|nr:MAG: bifunctional phosphoribosylaminoimidazolecarboxamide formyltransferase/IMP cyclohydrolase [candidate division NC10 bacterium RIFCSPLOWO2_02_FULL_66_22]